MCFTVLLHSFIRQLFADWLLILQIGGLSLVELSWNYTSQKSESLECFLTCHDSLFIIVKHQTRFKNLCKSRKFCLSGHFGGGLRGVPTLCLQIVSTALTSSSLTSIRASLVMWMPPLLRGSRTLSARRAIGWLLMTSLESKNNKFGQETEASNIALLKISIWSLSHSCRV